MTVLDREVDGGLLPFASVLICYVDDLVKLISVVILDMDIIRIKTLYFMNIIRIKNIYHGDVIRIKNVFIIDIIRIKNIFIMNIIRIKNIYISWT